MAPEFPSEITILDLAIGPVVFSLVVGAAYIIQAGRIKKEPYYVYFLPGLLVKLLGSICVCLVYLYFYKGGDTLNYFYSGRVLEELLFSDSKAFSRIFFLGESTPELASHFTSETGFPYYFTDHLTFFVVRLSVPFVLVSFNSFVAASLVFTFVSYFGIWKMFEVFVKEFPTIERSVAVSFLFIPSVFFWGSGILKDPITISAVGWYVHSFYFLVIRKNYQFKFVLYLGISSWILLSIKPYIFYVLFPTTLIWFLILYLRTFKSGLVRFITVPFVMAVFGFGTYLLLLQLGKDRAKFSIDNLLNYAKITQSDLKREEYGGSTFDVGNFDATLPSMIAKAPVAINYALFRPYIWEAKNPLMFFSAIENLLILVLAVYILLKIGIFKISKFLRAKPILLFSLLFSFLFAFSVGLSTSNFGALVRYKIPAIPFFVGSLFVLLFLEKQEKLKKTGKTD